MIDDTTQFKYEELYRKVTLHDVLAAYKAKGIFGAIAQIVMVAFAIFIASVFVAILLLILRNSGLMSIEIVYLLSSLAFLGSMTVYLSRQIADVKSSVNMRRFANANKVKFFTSKKADKLGVLSSIVDEPKFIHGFSSGQDWLVADLQFKGSAQSLQDKEDRISSPELFGACMRVSIGKKVPHIILYSKQNSTFFDLYDIKKYLHASQKDILEGDINKYFDIYTPEDYNVDLRYILSPELMAIIIDKAKDWNIELVDNFLYMYKKQPFKFHRKNVEQSLSENLATLMLFKREFSDNTHLYKDDKALDVAKGQISQQGRRLKGKVPFWTVVMFIVFILYIFFSMYVEYHE